MRCECEEMVNGLASVLAASMHRMAAVGAERTALYRFHIALKDPVAKVLRAMEAFQTSLFLLKSSRKHAF